MCAQLHYPPYLPVPISGAATDGSAATARDASALEEDRYHAAIFQAWACAFGETAIVYLSGPITTGKRLVSAIEEGRPLDTVLPENLAELRETARRLRRKIPPILVDPSPLAIAHWSQQEYMLLWRGLIERHAREVRFMPGWEYSRGCAEEFVHAISLDIPTLDLEGVPIACETGEALLGRAVEVLGRTRTGHGVLVDLASELDSQRRQLTLR